MGFIVPIYKVILFFLNNLDFDPAHFCCSRASEHARAETFRKIWFKVLHPF